MKFFLASIDATATIAPDEEYSGMHMMVVTLGEGQSFADAIADAEAYAHTEIVEGLAGHYGVDVADVKVTGFEYRTILSTGDLAYAPMGYMPGLGESHLVLEEDDIADLFEALFAWMGSGEATDGEDEEDESEPEPVQ